MTDTERLDFLLTSDIEQQGFKGKDGEYYELQVWDGGYSKTYTAPTLRECIDQAINYENNKFCTEDIN
ncbi:MAG: hypothetical protein ACW980_22505 [Promethearchaeota archaeon]